MTLIRQIAFAAFSLAALVATADDYFSDRWNFVLNRPSAPSTEWCPIYFSGYVDDHYLRGRDIAWALECIGQRQAIGYNQDPVVYDYNNWKSLSSGNLLEIFSRISKLRYNGTEGAHDHDEGWINNYSAWQEKIPFTWPPYSPDDGKFSAIFGLTAVHHSPLSAVEWELARSSIHNGARLKSSNFKTYIFDKLNHMNSYVKWQTSVNDSWFSDLTSGGTFTANIHYTVNNDFGKYKFPWKFTKEEEGEEYIIADPGAFANYECVYAHQVTAAWDFRDGFEQKLYNKTEVTVGYSTPLPDNIQFVVPQCGTYNSYGDCFGVFSIIRHKVDWDNPLDTRTTTSAQVVINMGVVYRGMTYGEIMYGHEVLARLKSIANQLGILDDVEFPEDEKLQRSKSKYFQNDEFFIRLDYYIPRIELGHTNLNY